MHFRSSFLALACAGAFAGACGTSGSSGNSETNEGSPSNGNTSSGASQSAGGASNGGQSTGGPSTGGASQAHGSSAATSGSGAASSAANASTGGSSGAAASSAAASNGSGSSAGSSNGGESIPAGPNNAAPISDDGGTTAGSTCTPPSAYGNLFVSVLGETQAAVDTKVGNAWTQLFHDPTNQNNVYYTGPAAGEAYILDVSDNDVRTEGMSYGMMVAVQLNHQAEFDALWAFVKHYMVESNGIIAWHTSTAGAQLNTGGAPDGDEWFATALIFAANRWGNTSGKYDYASEAQPVLDMIASQDFDATSSLVAFEPGANFTDGSYVLPAFYQVWACVDGKNQALWQKAIPASRTFFHNAANATTGLVPDHSSLTGAPQNNFNSDAVRVVVNVMMDHADFDVDNPWQTTWATTFANFFKGQGANYVDDYTPAGMAAGGSHSPHIIACNATLGFGVSSTLSKPFLQDLWNLAIPTGQYRYYDGMLYMLGLLHVSGNFQLWY